MFPRYASDLISPSLKSRSTTYFNSDLPNALQFIPNISQFIAKQNHYSDLALVSQNSKKSNLKRKFKAIFNPFWTFFRLFILKGGFLEGWHGFVIAKLYAQYTFWKYVK